jgi:hypothetical protein
MKKISYYGYNVLRCSMLFIVCIVSLFYDVSVSIVSALAMLFISEMNDNKASNRL